MSHYFEVFKTVITIETGDIGGALVTLIMMIIGTPPCDGETNVESWVSASDPKRGITVGIVTATAQAATATATATTAPRPPNTRETIRA